MLEDPHVSTRARAMATTVLATAVIGGVLEFADLVSATGSVEVDVPVWSPLAVVGELGRLALLAAVGASVAGL